MAVFGLPHTLAAHELASFAQYLASPGHNVVEYLGQVQHPVGSGPEAL